MADDTTRAPSSGSGMQPIDFSAPVPNATAPAAVATCSKCAAPIAGYYYESNGAVYCARCKRLTEEADAKGGTGAGAFGRGALLGLGAAIVGAFGYWAFMKITGIDWALVSIAVGILVATAIRKGNGGQGGRRYQVLAVALTYLAIGGANAPLIIEGVLDHGTSTQHASATSSASSSNGKGAAAPTADSSAAASDADTGDDATAAAAATSGRAATAAKANVSPLGRIGFFLLAVLAIALAGPVLAIVAGGFPGSIINLAIVGFALRRAWIMAGVGGVATAGHGFTGPYNVKSRPPSPAGV